jgi:hypothetical protein
MLRHLAQPGALIVWRSRVIFIVLLTRTYRRRGGGAAADAVSADGAGAPLAAAICTIFLRQTAILPVP